MPPRERQTIHMTPADYIRKHSPIKKGLKISDEDKPLAKYNKIMSKIYLGNHQAAKDRAFFTDKKIKAVLNCSKDIPNTFVCQKDIEYMRIPVDDSLKEVDFVKMYNYLNIMAEFIYKHAVLQNEAILIHCWAGRQRSVAGVAAYLIAYGDMNVHEASKFIMDRRPEAMHFGTSFNFDQALIQFHSDIKKYPKKFKRSFPKFIKKK